MNCFTCYLQVRVHKLPVIQGFWEIVSNPTFELVSDFRSLKFSDFILQNCQKLLYKIKILTFSASVEEARRFLTAFQAFFYVVN